MAMAEAEILRPVPSSIIIKELAPRPGFEPATRRLTAVDDGFSPISPGSTQNASNPTRRMVRRSRRRSTQRYPIIRFVTETPTKSPTLKSTLSRRSTRKQNAARPRPNPATAPACPRSERPLQLSLVPALGTMLRCQACG